MDSGTEPNKREVKRRHPPWLRVKIGKDTAARVSRMIKDARLNTVCQEAACPNIGECWEAGTATLMLMGSVCTRGCKFCNIATGRPDALDAGEPLRVAETVKAMGLKYAVITSVDRDDLEDGGANHFRETVRAVRVLNPGIRVEILTPDFKNKPSAPAIIIDTKPDVMNHNIETVPRLYRQVRPGAVYEGSLGLLRTCTEGGLLTKCGFMVGVGETIEEIVQTMKDIRSAGVSILTVGQYLQPSKKHLPVDKYYHPDEFEEIRKEALKVGFPAVESGPLVRSSYHAEKAADLMEEIFAKHQRGEFH
jgi:lipoic acid synthetase